MSLDTQAQDLHRVVTQFIRAHRHRDRDEICCHGVTVAQCYALEAIRELGEPKMSDLADALRVSVSTLTRTLDPLVEQGLVERGVRESDRRVSCACLTPRGRERIEAITAELLGVERRVLEALSPDERDTVIRTLKSLVAALERWRSNGTECC